MVNQLSAARITSSTKQHKPICQSRTNTTACTWPANDHSNGVRNHSNNNTRNPHTFLQRVFSGEKITKQCDTGTNACHHRFLPWTLYTYSHLRVAQLNNRRNLYNTTLEAPETQPLAMLLCGFFWGSNRITTTSSFSHACACHAYTHVCMYVRVPTEIQ